MSIDMKGKAARPLIGVVGDSETNREVTSRLLTSAGYRTAVFESAAAFVEGDKNDVLCLVLDLDIPESGGLILKGELAQINVSIPIIFVTAKEDVLKAIALNDGAGAILGTPFTEEALLGAIRSAMNFPKQSKRIK